jgi:hypothetical protein
MKKTIDENNNNVVENIRFTNVNINEIDKNDPATSKNVFDKTKKPIQPINKE